MLPPFGDIVRNSSIVNSSSGVNGLPFAWSGSPLIALTKDCPHFGVAAMLHQARHDAEDRIAPLAQRHEIVKTFEHNVLTGEMLSIPGVLEPVPGHGLVRVGGAPALEILDPLVDPLP